MQADRQALLLISTWHLGRMRPMAGQQQKMEEEPVPSAALTIMEEACDRRMLNAPMQQSWTRVLSWMLAKEPGQELGRSELSLHASRDRADSTAPGGETPLCPSPLHP